ncbi:MAG: helix-turn-helix transcriptional regulator [bacterium]|nr:helix-turn-helix transcriptional regulator [bacterium]
MLTPEASRAARGLLNWSLKDLAEKAGVAFTTISQFENGRPAYGTTADKIAAAFVAEGVELVATEDRTGAVLIYAPRQGRGGRHGV